jgi:PAS domain S-box-containing protein
MNESRVHTLKNPPVATPQDLTEDSPGSSRQQEDQRDFLRQVIDMNPCLIFVKDREGRFTLVNQVVAEVYGTTVENLVGKTDADFNSSEEEVEHFLRDDLEVMNTLKEKLIPEEVITDANGRTRYLQTSKRPLVDRDGIARHVLGVATDITQLKLGEKERGNLQAQVQHAQKLESLGILAGGIAHDFNNLLMGVMGYADLAQMEIPPGSEAQESIKQIQLAAQRAADLCKQLLDYSGKGRFVVEPVQLTETVEEITDLLKVSISKKAALHFDLAKHIPRIAADPTQVRQVIMNLITNASDAIEDNEGVISVVTGTMECPSDCLQGLVVGDDIRPGTFVFLEVTDNGVGMDKETVDKIFDPFFTTKFSGRGLGLAAVLGIVRGHEGAIKVTSERGRGTTVKALFPAFELDVPWDERRPNQQDWRSQGTILVVDDEEMVRGAAKRILEHSGFTVLTASDGLEAVEIFRQKAEETLVVLLDLTMPHMNGEQTYEEIQKIRAGTPVILMSGFSEPDARHRFREGRLAGFLTKPFRASEIIDSIRRIQETSPAP